MRRLIHRVRLLLGRAHAERAMDDEMRHHIDCEAADNVARGMEASAARTKAMRDFGGVEQFKEAGRDARGIRLVGDLIADTHYAVRVLRRNPGFTLAGVATFALGIGAAAAIFGVVRGVLLRPLPYRAPDELVTLWERNVAKGADHNVVSMASFEAWRERSRSFNGMAALVPAPATAVVNGVAERVAGVQVSAGYFRLLGIAPAIGREFSPAEAASAINVTVLSHDFWRRHFGFDSSIVGRAIEIDGKTVTVVGIMPATFDPPRFGWIDEQELWLPYGPISAYQPWGRAFHVVARLRTGVSIARADAEMASLGGQLAAEIPANSGWSATVSSLATQITGDVRRPLLLLLGGVLLLLVMSVVNVANLALGLARRREAEFAVRRAIGGSTSRLLRQLFVQNGLLALLGCAAGIGVAALGLRGLIALMPPNMPRTGSIHLDATVLSLALIVTVGASLLFGSIAALRGSRDAGLSAMALRSARSGPGASRWGGNALVTVEVALALLITVLAALMVRSFANLRSIPTGFNASGIVAGRIGLAGDRYAGPDLERRFFDELTARLRTAPGVTSVSIANVRPFRGGSPVTSVIDPLHPLARGVEPPSVDIRFVDSTFFATLRIPLTTGHGFSAIEATGGAAHIVISATLARTLGLGANPIGHHISIGLFNNLDAEIVGVAADVHLYDLRAPIRGAAYLPASRFPSSVYDVLLRGEGGPERLANVLRSTVSGMDPGLPVYDAEPLQAVIDRSTARDRFTMSVLGLFAFISLMLAGVGIYGVSSADVASRRREIGIRRALGASGGGVVAAAVRRTFIQAAIGIAAGLVAALLATRAIASLLFGIGATDPVAFTAVAALLLGVTVIATIIPAWRATRVSPLLAIRSE